MKLKNIGVWALFLVIGFLAAVPVQAVEKYSLLAKWDFEEDLKGWVLDAPAKDFIFTLENNGARSGKACIRVERLQEGSGYIYSLIRLPQGSRFNKVKVRFFVRTKDLADGEAVVKMLAWSGGKPIDAIRNNGKEPLVALPASAQWTQVEGSGPMPSNTEALSMSIENAAGKGVVWLDDISVEGLFEETAVNQNTDKNQSVEKPAFLTDWFRSSRLGHVFPANQGRVEVVIPDSGKMTSGSVVVTDEEEKILNQIPIPPGTSGIAVELPSKGFYSIKANATFQDGSVKTSSTTATVAGDLIPDEVRLRSPFGMWHLKGDLSLMEAAGARWTREMMALMYLKPEFLQGEPEPNLEKRKTDVNVKRLAEQFTSIGVFAFGLPDWMVDMPAGFKRETLYDNLLRFPKNWSQLEQLVQVFARNMVGFPPYFEVYNEPNGSGWKGTDEELVKFHAVVAKAIKSVHPDVKIVGPCIHSSDPIIKRLINLGLLKYLDGISFHPYPGTPPEIELLSWMREWKTYLASIGYKDFPIYLTEFGWTKVPTSGYVTIDSDLTQSRYVSRCLVLLATENIESIIYFGLLFPSEPGWSLLYNNQTPKPAYAAFANVTRWLSGAEKDSKLLQVTPTSYLALFRKGEGLVAVAWDTQGKATIAIPKPWGKVEDMTGRPITNRAESLVAISPSPVFVEIKDNSFFKLTLRKPISLVQGRQTGAVLPWEQAIVPPPLVQKGKIITAPLNFPTGRYLVLGKTAQGWEGLPVDVFSPLNIDAAQVAWPLSEEFPSFQVSVHSYFDHPVKVQATMKRAKTADVFAAPLVINPNSTVCFSLPLENIPAGEHHRATVLVETTEESVYNYSEQSVDIAFAGGCLPVAGPSGKPNWEAVAPMADASAWKPFIISKPGAEVTIPKTDCSAILKTAYSDLGLYLEIQIEDDQHLQRQPPGDMWQEDSIQLAFDVATGQDLESGKRRVFEYGVARGEEGAMIWRWTSPDPKFPSETTEPRVWAEVNRQGTVTRYEITFPWEVLALSQKPKSGTSIGFALAVNDQDESPLGRHGVKFFDGIVHSKDPSVFGRLLFR